MLNYFFVNYFGTCITFFLQSFPRSFLEQQTEIHSQISVKQNHQQKLWAKLIFLT